MRQTVALGTAASGMRRMVLALAMLGATSGCNGQRLLSELGCDGSTSSIDINRDQLAVKQLVRTSTESTDTEDRKEVARGSNLFDDWNQLQTIDIPSGGKSVDLEGRIRVLWLHSSDTTCVRHQIENAPDLISLHLEFSAVDDLALEPLSKCEHLQEIYVGAPEDFGELGQVTNATVKMIARFPSLTTAHLRSWRIDDDAIRYFDGKKLPHLIELDLSGCSLSDGAIASLSGLTSLRRLVLMQTDFTEEGIEKLRRALPNTDIQI